MDERFVAATAGPRLLTGVLVTFAVLTAVLAAIGVYGLLAWTVSERRRELAIRLALGAQPGALARLVTAQGLMLAALGVVLGLAGAQLARGLLRDVLFETRPTDVAGTDDGGGRAGAGGGGRLPGARAARDAGESGRGDEVGSGFGSGSGLRAVDSAGRRCLSGSTASGAEASSPDVPEHNAVCFVSATQKRWSVRRLDAQRRTRPKFTCVG